jgi:hypothetical protein
MKAGIVVNWQIKKVAREIKARENHINSVILMPKPLYLLFKKVYNLLKSNDLLLDPKLVIHKDKQALSEKALQTKGIWNYVKQIKEKTLKSRMMYGFLKKRSKGKVKYFTSRWFFLISSRPLVTQTLILNNL